MANKYPMIVLIETPDGSGEAYKEKMNDAWKVSFPGGDMRWHGSITQMQKEALRRMGHAKSDVTFTLKRN